MRKKVALSVAGLFAGIGGLELGFKKAGHKSNLLCEVDDAACSVLRTQFPGIAIANDIRNLRALPAGTDVLLAGFPCQDLSQAGRTAGISGERSGLVGEVFRLLDKQTVPIVVLENVPFMLQLSKGEAMNVIVSEFERRGYRWAYRIVDSRSFGLPQRRERVYFVACIDRDPREILFADDFEEPTVEGINWSVANGFYWTEGTRGLGWASNAVPTLKGGSTIGIPSPPAIVLPDGSVVTPDIRDAERMQGFPADWTLPAELAGFRKSARWKLVGNAVSVNVAEWLGNRVARPVRRGADVASAPLPSGQLKWPRAAFNVNGQRCFADVSAFPMNTESIQLHKFLEFEPRSLSFKATSGFLSRARKSTLRFPDGFLDRLDAHLERMGEDVVETRRKKSKNADL